MSKMSPEFIGQGATGVTHRARSRLCHVGKWMLLAACLLVAVLWAASLWIRPGVYAGAWSFDVQDGCASLSVIPSAGYRPLTIGLLKSEGRWSHGIFLPRIVHLGSHWYTAWPLWIPLAVLAGSTVLVWRSTKPWRPECCDGCGYDLSGSTSGICPECGTPIPKNLRSIPGPTLNVDPPPAPPQG